MDSSDHISDSCLLSTSLMNLYITRMNPCTLTSKTGKNYHNVKR